MCKKLYIVFFVSLSLILLSCNNRKGSIDVEEPALKHSRSHQMDYFFPSPNEVVDVLLESNFEFNPDYLTEIDLKKSYGDNRSKSLQLGIYTTDLAYVVQSGDTQAALMYLDVVFYLSNELNISNIATIETVERIKGNMNVLDSLQYISNELFVDFIEILKEDSREEVLAMVSVGAYIEAFYIASHSINSYIDNFETVKAISNQRLAYENCIDFIRLYQSDESIASLLKDISSLNNYYKNIQPIKNTSRLISNKSNRLVFGSGYQYIMSEDQFEIYKNELVRLKQLFVN